MIGRGQRLPRRYNLYASGLIGNEVRFVPYFTVILFLSSICMRKGGRKSVPVLQQNDGIIVPFHGLPATAHGLGETERADGIAGTHPANLSRSPTLPLFPAFGRRNCQVLRHST